MRRFYLFLFVFILPFQFGWAQRAPGDWEYHLSMTSTSKVVEAGNKIYFMSDGGIFYFNKEDNSIETITKLEGLSGSDFSLLSYNESMKCVIVAYKNSVIDVIYSDGSIHPIFDIKRKNIIGDKLIYSATNVDNLCYLSCGFGIVVLDLEKLEIKDSYIIGDGGNYLTIYGLGFIDNYVFAGTKEGIKYAPASGTNLLDYSNWKNVENAFLRDYNYNLITAGWGRLWAVHQSDEWHGDRTFSRHAADVWYPEYEDYSVIRDLEFAHDNMVYCLENSVIVYNSQRQKSLVIDNYPFASESVGMKPLSAIVDASGTVWIADGNYGAVRYENGTFTQISPDGPFNNNVFSLTFSDNQLWSTSGGHSSYWGQLYIDFNVNKYSGGQWESYNRFTGAVDQGYWDAVQVLPFPGETDHCYVATWGQGMLEMKNGKVVKVYDDKNSSSTLQSAIPGEPYIRVGGMDFDSNGNLWVSNSKVNYNLHKLKADGTWTSYFLPEIANSFEVGQVMVTSNDDIWMIVPRKATSGMYVMSNDGKQTKLLNISSYFSNGEQEEITDMNNVYSMAEDKEGAIWVGTSTGIAVYNNPQNVFDTSPFYANQPGVDLNDGTYHPLLKNITVTAIAVDGGNRKWCGTSTDGLFLISDDGQDEIEHFTADNSGLLSDAITSLAYDEATGILYVGTQLGLASYQTDSKGESSSFANVYAYPNPVRETYTGNIYITGLMYDTNVKITTVSGRLVYETTSNGGQAVWNGKDLAGNRVHTGVYLAYCASSDGTQSTVTKILFIR